MSLGQLQALLSKERRFCSDKKLIGVSLILISSNSTYKSSAFSDKTEP
jgi:hypothetical protein